jgi:hypothetical protein
MALKPASSGERKLCQNQVFHSIFFLSFFSPRISLCGSIPKASTQAQLPTSYLRKGDFFFVSIRDFANNFGKPSIYIYTECPLIRSFAGTT